MNTLGLAIRTLLRILRDRAFAEQIKTLGDAPARETRPAQPPAPVRSDALTLLALLQREGRLVDFFQESIDTYTDAQIGAAARDVHKGGAAVLDQAFGLEPLRTEPEDSTVSVPAGFETAEVKLTGNVVGEPPYQGTLRHHGWRATRCELPVWTGSPAAAAIVTPAEVELG